MSTLTESPSPVPSPRSTFPIPRSSFKVPSPRPSPRNTTYASSTSPRQPLYAPVSGARKVPTTESAAPEKTSRYVDAGTQYSPDGYPPTAPRRFRPSGKEREIAVATPSWSSRKRKEREGALAFSSPGDPMNTSSGNSSTGSATRPPPPEPTLRVQPSSQDAQQQGSGVAGPSTRTEAEPEEARSTHGHSSAPKRSKPEPGTTKVMPVLYQFSNAKELGHLISSMLMELIRINDQIPLRDGRLTRFHSRAPPGISVSDYLQRLVHHATLSPPILLSMVWYIDRLCQLYPAFTINSLTVHRFLITAATVAAKGLSDSFWTNPTYARIGGIPVGELATLELEFLQKVQWKIVPQPEVLEDYYRSLVERTEGYELEQQASEDEGSTSVGTSEDGEAEKAADGEHKKDEDEEMSDGKEAPS